MPFPMKTRLPRFGEFIALIAMLTSLTALSIDAILPALGLIRQDMGIQNDNDAQLVISTLFLGLACGQVFFGPLSDATGRKPLMYVGLVLFMLGCLVVMLSQDFTHVLIGRFLQGLGASAPRVITMALVRDCYSGREMARVMSFMMSVFIMVPVLAPTLGQGILLIADWRSIFASLMLMALIVLLWFKLRMPETLSDEKRRPFTFSQFWQGAYSVITNRTAMRYTVATGLVFGAFLGYLNSAQQILQIQYGLGERFPLYFALLALGIGGASFLNGRLVMRYGMYLLSQRAALVFTVLAGLFLVVAWQTDGHPPLAVLMIGLLLLFLPSVCCLAT